MNENQWQQAYWSDEFKWGNFNFKLFSGCKGRGECLQLSVKHGGGSTVDSALFQPVVLGILLKLKKL